MIEVVVSVIATVVLVVIAVALEAAGCSARWEDSGMESKYLLTAGCMVKKDGRWVPEGVLRDVGL